jgi:hypothetical protein
MLLCQKHDNYIGGGSKYKMSRREYRERQFSIDFTLERDIYLNLCDSLSRKRKKEIDDKKVISYKSWREKTESWIKDADLKLEDLVEFSKYLKLVSKKKSDALAIINQLLFPFSVALMVGVIMNFFSGMVSGNDLIGNVIGYFLMLVVFLFGFMQIYKNYSSESHTAMYYDELRHVVEDMIHNYIH